MLKFTPTVLSGEDMSQLQLITTANYQCACYTQRSPISTTVNQDSLAILPLNDESIILAVADGLGGQPAGSSASRIAVDTLTKLSQQNADVSLRENILDSFEQANSSIINLATGSATTFSVVSLEKNILRPFHVGDSTIIVTGQRGKIKLQTTSHSPVGYAVESGILDENDAIHHEERHFVLNTVGSPEMRIEIGPEISLAPHDTVLLASDGLFDNLYIDEIIEIIRKGPLGDAMASLIDKVQHRMLHAEQDKPSHPDDLSIILLRQL